MIPLALYVHIPWCERKCPYCDFNSHAIDPAASQGTGQVTKAIPEEERYVDALLSDLDYDWALCRGRKLCSIFIGGGTPSIVSAAALGRLLDGIDKCCTIPDRCEISMEANPGSAEYARFCDFRKAGINRLSIGVQSFNNTQLQRLGRVHNADDATSAVRAAFKAGFDNINIDLMYGLPGQGISDALDDIERARQLDVSHLSWYQLTIEPNTYFYRHTPRLPGEEVVYSQYENGSALLGEAGYQRYEVSAWAKTAAQCLHNTNYWRFGDYLGIGAGACGKLSLRTGARGCANSAGHGQKLKVWRTYKKRMPQHYMQGLSRHSDARDMNSAHEPGMQPFTARAQLLSREELALEFMMNALRLDNGCHERLFEQRTGLGIEHWHALISDLRESRLWLDEDDRIGLSKRGRELLNEVLLRFMPGQRQDLPLASDVHSPSEIMRAQY